MKLNEDWDQVYRSATLGLQHRMEALELENTAIKQLNSRLLLKVEHQQVNTAAMLQACTWKVYTNSHRHTHKGHCTNTDLEKWV